MNDKIKQQLSEFIADSGLDPLVGLQLLLDFENAFNKAMEEQNNRKAYNEAMEEFRLVYKP
jgi:hypothetical protein